MPVRLLWVLAIVAPILFGGTCLRAAAPQTSAATASESKTAKPALAALFSELAAAKSDSEARQVEDRIWNIWLKAPDLESQSLLEESKQAQNAFDYQGALLALGKLIERAPEYAEAWNQRAFVLFLMGAYEDSLVAIERTLEREPRHYGALAGKGVILMMTGREAQGQAALREAHKINPWLKERGLITDSAGRKI
jgi:tetratricopeptide (TPR) repeat protein